MEKWRKFSKEQIFAFYNQAKNKTNFLELMGYKCYNKSALKNIANEYPELDLEALSANKFQDLSNQSFGRLTVLYKDEFNYKNSNITHWICQCSCENKTILSVSRSHLISGHTKSCGCLSKEKHSKDKRKDLKGQRFGKLIVKDVAPSKISPNGRSHACWYCDCDCGRKNIIVSTDALRQGKESCGCSFSKGEDRIEKWLIENKFNYQRQFSFAELKGEKKELRFDFAIFEDNFLICLIEYQGEQHYQVVDIFDGETGLKQRQLNDQKKRDYCDKNNIYLLEIPYWSYSEIENILENELKKELMEG